VDRHGEKHFLMIAHERKQTAPARKGQELVEDAAAVGSAVDVVAERDDFVLRAWLDSLDQGRQRPGAAVEVADGNRSAIGSGIIL
jgi:hypothetical protein